MKNNKETILNKRALARAMGVPPHKLNKYPQSIEDISLGNVMLIKDLLNKELKRIESKINVDKNDNRETTAQ